MSVLPPFGWTAAVSCVAAAQLAAALRFRWRSRRRSPSRRETAFLSVVVPFKGVFPGLEANVQALLEQDYAGPVEWLFVTASAQDPALAVLRRCAAERPNVKAIVSNAAPRAASEKALNLLAGVAAAAPASRALLFADADVRVRPDWARLMTAALEEPGTTLATAALVDVPAAGPASRLRLVWMAFGLPWFEPMGLAVGQSLALKRADFDALGVAALWRESVSDDLALAARVRARGGRVRFVAAASPDGAEPFPPVAVIAQSNRWMTLFRFYQPRVWTLGLLSTAIKIAALAQSLQRPFCPALGALVLLPDAACAALALDALGQGRRRLWPNALLAPLLIPLFAVNFAVSAFFGEIVWSGWTYRLDRPEALAGAEPARRARRRRALRLAAAALGGTALGLAFHPGPLGLLAWAAFLPLLWIIDGEPPRRALAWGAFFGACAYACAYPWFYGFIRRFLRVDAPEAAFWFTALCALQGLRFGLVAAVSAAAPPGLRRAALFVFAAVAAEYFLPSLFVISLATTQTFDLPLLQSVSRDGAAGLAWMIVGANAAIYLLLSRRRAWATLPALLLMTAVVLERSWGRGVAASVEEEASRRPALRMGAVQGGADLASYGALTRRAAAAGAADLIVWPESVFAPELDYDLSSPKDISARGASLRESLRGAAPPPVPLLLNSTGLAPDGRRRNVSVLLDSSAAPLGVVEKQVLAPFGEYIPGGSPFSFLRRVSPGTTDLAPGTQPRLLALDGARLGALICYDSLEPEPARRLSALGADVFVSQANDASVGSSLAAEQHLQAVILRAVENRRAVLHAAATGVSAVVAPSGRVIARLDAGAAGALAASIPRMETRTGAAERARGLYSLAAVLCAAGVAFARRTVPRRA